MKISDQKFREILTRYLEGTATSAERKMLDSFFSSYESGSQGSQHLPNERREKMLRKIHSRLGLKKKTNRFISLWIPLAAAICVFVMVYFYTTPTEFPSAVPAQQVVFMKDSTVRGQKSAVLLADGTKVYLNSNTTISHPQHFGTIREVTVMGEAFFEVTKNGKPFVVHSGELATRVLGTSFNVRHRPGKNTEVTLVEGKVKVQLRGGKSLLLSPDQQAIMTPDATELVKRAVDSKRYTYWKENTLYFERTSLADAIEEIEEWYAVKIEIGNKAIGQCEITGKYQDEPLGNVLSSLQFLFKLDIRRVGNHHYRVYGKGCK